MPTACYFDEEEETENPQTREKLCGSSLKRHKRTAAVTGNETHSGRAACGDRRRSASSEKRRARQRICQLSVFSDSSRARAASNARLTHPTGSMSSLSLRLLDDPLPYVRFRYSSHDGISSELHSGTSWPGVEQPFLYSSAKQCIHPPFAPPA